jgi:hypothetical protein
MATEIGLTFSNPNQTLTTPALATAGTVAIGAAVGLARHGFLNAPEETKRLLPSSGGEEAPATTPAPPQ